MSRNLEEKQIAQIIQTSESSDSEVIQRVKSGMRDEYRILVTRHQDALYRLLLRQTGDSGVAHDLAQDTFIRAFSSLSSFREDSTFSTWITRIALNLSNNYFASRTYKERKRTLQNASQQEPHVSAGVEIEQKLVLLREFISELKPKYRDAITLCGLEKKSYEEAASILKIPV